ncbi:MAG: hypothetical protein KDA91_07300 [Planctomycetaceae bacterium]|nr:hypothetical protein [Planctomycetaceae bacterium]
MKNSIFKVMAVIMTVVSVTLAGMAWVANFNSPHHLSEMSTEPMQDYTFEKGVGIEPTWTVTRRVGEPGTLGSPSPNPYEAIIKAHKDLQSRKQAATTEANDRVALLTNADNGLIPSFKASQEQDQAAMTVRRQQLEQALTQVKAQLLKLSEELQALSVQSKAIRDETDVRRTDVSRLRNELEEARTDLYRLDQLKRELTDRLVRLQIENQTLNERQEQLSSQTNGAGGSQI